MLRNVAVFVLLVLVLHLFDFLPPPPSFFLSLSLSLSLSPPPSLSKTHQDYVPCQEYDGALPRALAAVPALVQHVPRQLIALIIRLRGFFFFIV